MRKLTEAVIRRATGKTDDQLAASYAWHHFCTRSAVRAYWRTLIQA
jgi:hypothetical protein